MQLGLIMRTYGLTTVIAINPPLGGDCVGLPGFIGLDGGRCPCTPAFIAFRVRGTRSLDETVKSALDIYAVPIYLLVRWRRILVNPSR
jgi:hypothetical protein